MRELSVFVDESGDFGPYSEHSPYYIIAVVFHDQADDISQLVHTLDIRLENIAHKKICSHIGPLIRAEAEYKDMSLANRRKVFNAMMSFVRTAKFHYTYFAVQKKYFNDRVKLVSKLAAEFSHFFIARKPEIEKFDAVKVYYDNGQLEISKILSSVLGTFVNEKVRFRKVVPANYKFFQVADLVCSVSLLDLKSEAGTLNRSELLFFGSQRNLRKNVLKVLQRHKLG